MKLKSIKNIKNLKGKTVLCRIDLNIELTGARPDEFLNLKIKKTLPTVRLLLDRGARVILLSHFGRPKRKDAKHSLRRFVKYLENHLRERVDFLQTPNAAIVKKSKKRLFLLENLRFFDGEEKNDQKFAEELAKLGDIYVNEAFAASHRAHASVSAITRLLSSYAGPLLEQEVETLGKILKKPKRPFIVLLGGSKISTKEDLIKNLTKLADYVLVGGALAHPFLAAKGYNIGRSSIEKNSVLLAKQLLSKKVILPVDAVLTCKRKVCIKPVQMLDYNDKIWDIGPATIFRFSNFLREAKTIIWNGPMGVFEKEEFSHGSIALARFIASRASGKAYGVLGGGETLAVLARTGMQEYIDWVSAGGGAMLEFLAGKMLPGIKPLLKQES